MWPRSKGQSLKSNVDCDGIGGRRGLHTFLAVELIHPHAGRDPDSREWRGGFQKAVMRDLDCPCLQSYDGRVEVPNNLGSAKCHSLCRAGAYIHSLQLLPRACRPVYNMISRLLCKHLHDDRLIYGN